MAERFKLTDMVGDIVAAYPGAANLFLEKKVDFCCGGARSLEAAARESRHSGEELLMELNRLYEEFAVKNEVFTDWVQEKPAKLADYILNKHHSYLHQELPDLGDLVLTILNVHGMSHPELFKVHRLFNALKTELEEHLIREEQILFPAIEAYEYDDGSEGKAAIAALIAELEAEHTGAGDIIKELREVTNHYSVPRDACRTYAATYKKLMEMEADLFQHIHLENNILFRKFH